MKITPTCLTVTQLLTAANEQYVVPAYQRRYSWRDKQRGELLDDVDLLSGNDTHLLGTIVCLAAHHVPDINQLELVDGQQRLTTISILLYCIRDRLKAEGKESEVQEIVRRLRAKALWGRVDRKILLDSLDSSEYETLGKGASPATPQNAHLCRAFAHFRQWVEERKTEDLLTFLYRLTNQCLVIRLDVGDAKDAFKLFE